MTDDEIEEEIDRIIGHRRLVWLFGAGASFTSGLPLMTGLTWKILDIANSAKPMKNSSGADYSLKDFLDNILAELGPGSTIEQALDHLADYMAISNRSSSKTITTSSGTFRFDSLASARMEILSAIRNTIRYGFQYNVDPALCITGTAENPIVTVEHHLRFTETLFSEILADRSSASTVDIFTTNYDTLFEDALALNSIDSVDGFKGAAVGYWAPEIYETQGRARARLFKLHGSIDWTLIGGKIVRRRLGDLYPPAASDLLIYPQATKYDLTRREPFDTLFHQFRLALGGKEARVLAVCGYGFGDAHINLDIETAMSRPGSNLTLLAFAPSAPKALEDWLGRSFGERIYVMTQDGIRRGADPIARIPSGAKHDWWTFEGMTKRIRNARASSGGTP